MRTMRKMRALLCVCVCLCVSAAWAQGDLEYDDYDQGSTKNETDKAATVDARGHRPLTRGGDTYTRSRYAPPPISGGGRYASVPDPNNDNSTGLMRHSGRCYYEPKSTHLIGAFVPQCDENEDFLPQQCWGSTGYCWCVNTITGKEIPNTKARPWIKSVDCTATVDARDTYTRSRYAPPPISGGGRYRGRPTPAPAAGQQLLEKQKQPEDGGCMHAAEEMGVLCPTGCELKTMMLKQRSSVKTSINGLKPQVEDLTRDSNNIYNRVHSISTSLRERQRIITDNGQVINQYTSSVEEQHTYIKHTVDSVFPSSIRVLQGVLERIRLKIQKLEKAIQGQREECKEPCKTTCPIPVVSGKECEDIYRRGGKDSQMYFIQPDAFQPPYKVFCDQTTQNGGWVVIQNRLDGSVDFGRRWDEYRRGFGNTAFDVGKGHCETQGEHWLGNDRMSQLTKMGPTEVLMEMQDWSGAKVYAQYRQFTIMTETANYQLAVNGYSGNAGNSLLEGSSELFGENRTMTIHNSMMFSTYDRDNDNWIPGDPSKQCAREDGGGWWYNRCHSANPNGRYYIGGAYTSHMAKHGTDDGMVWMNWKGSWYSLKALSMKIRPYIASSMHDQSMQDQTKHG